MRTNAVRRTAGGEPSSNPPVAPTLKGDAQFAQRKKVILESLGRSALDYSPKGSVDRKCKKLIELLNTHPDYVTTSSCSGRIALFHSLDSQTGEASESVSTRMKKGLPGSKGWIFVKHGMLRPGEMQLLVNLICGIPQSQEACDVDKRENEVAEALYASHCNLPFGEELYTGEENETTQSLESLGPTELSHELPRFGTLSLKMEPFVLHVQCKNVESGKLILNAAISDSGFRNSGMIPPGKKVICAIRAAPGLGLDVPLQINGVNYMNRSYCWALLQTANMKMRHNEEKTNLLYHSLQSRLNETVS